MITTNLDRYYFPLRGFTTNVNENDDFNQIPLNCQYIIYFQGYEGASLDRAKEFINWLNDNVQEEGMPFLKGLSIPFDVLEEADWISLAPRLEHLRFNPPISKDLWSMYTQRDLPNFPSTEFRVLKTLQLPCPLAKWSAFDITRFPSLEWLNIELEAMDKRGTSLRLASRNKNIIGFGICDPKGHEFLDFIPDNIKGLAIYRLGARKFDFLRLTRFRDLRYLRLVGSSCVVDLDFVLSLPNLEELEVFTHLDVLNTESLLNLQYLRHLKICLIENDYNFPESVKKELERRVASYDFY